MNFENFFILPNHIGERSRYILWGIFIKIPKVTFKRSSLLFIHRNLLAVPWGDRDNDGYLAGNNPFYNTPL